MTDWNQAWTVLESKHPQFGKRDGQQSLGEAIFSNVVDGKQLVTEAPTGTGKSLAALIPLIHVVKTKKQRSVLSTETLALLDQIVDKDLPLLYSVYKGFSFAGLKGRNHYLCLSKCGRDDPLIASIVSRIGERGERRDIERLLGHRLSDSDWSTVNGDSDYCSSNRCSADNCYSTKARDKAAAADIVITSHAMVRTHAEMLSQGSDEGVLGDVTHIVIDEAHTFEQVVVDGLSLTLAPWDLYKKLKAISTATNLVGHKASADTGTKYAGEALAIIQRMMMELHPEVKFDQWHRETLTLGQVNLIGGQPISVVNAMTNYEEVAPDILNKASKTFESLSKKLSVISEDADKGKSKIKKGANAAMYLSSMLGIMALSIPTRDGILEIFGSTYAVFSDGISGTDYIGKDKREVSIRAVPLDVSGFLKFSLWNTCRSVTIMSATLKDQKTEDFRYLKRSLGLSMDSSELVVGTPFDYATQQLVYITDGTRPTENLMGAKYSLNELVELINATEGRSLVLFTAKTELEDAVLKLKYSPDFKWRLLVQETGVDKAKLVEDFKSDNESVLFGLKSFFTGVDFQGSTCSLVALVKYPNLQYGPLTRAQITYWRKQGFPDWYTSKSLEVFTQAAGRLIRSDGCKGTIALLDSRAADKGESVYKTVSEAIPRLYRGSRVTHDVSDVRDWVFS